MERRNNGVTMTDASAVHHSTIARERGEDDAPLPTRRQAASAN
jgi:hypothetical protein